MVRHPALASALALRPNYAEVHSNMSLLLLDQAQFSNAVDTALRAIRINPRLPDAYVKGDQLSITDRMLLDFALGKAHLDLGDSDRAFRHLALGNAAKRATFYYDSASTTKWMASDLPLLDALGRAP